MAKVEKYATGLIRGHWLRKITAHLLWNTMLTDKNHAICCQKILTCMTKSPCCKVKKASYNSTSN